MLWPPLREPGFELIQRIMRYSRLPDKIDPKIGAGRSNNPECRNMDSPVLRVTSLQESVRLTDAALGT